MAARRAASTDWQQTAIGVITWIEKAIQPGQFVQKRNHAGVRAVSHEEAGGRVLRDTQLKLAFVRIVCAQDLAHGLIAGDGKTCYELSSCRAHDGTGEPVMFGVGGCEQPMLVCPLLQAGGLYGRSEEHTSELQSRPHLVCRLLLEKKKKQE